MIKCNPECLPCCDFCVHVIQDEETLPDGRKVTYGPIGCSLHKDKEHQEIAEWDGYCEDFHCFRVKEKDNETEME